jgi:hypothetical protein
VSVPGPTSPCPPQSVEGVPAGWTGRRGQGAAATKESQEKPLTRCGLSANSIGVRLGNGLGVRPGLRVNLVDAKNMGASGSMGRRIVKGRGRTVRLEFGVVDGLLPG